MNLSRLNSLGPYRPHPPARHVNIRPLKEERESCCSRVAGVACDILARVFVVASAAAVVYLGLESLRADYKFFK